MRTIEKKAYMAMATASLFLLAGYTFVRSSSPVLFIAEFGKENLPVALAVMTFLAFVFIALYSKSLSKFGVRKTLYFFCALTVAILGGSYGLIKMGNTWASAIVHIYKDIYIVLLTEQLWSFINTHVGIKTAKRFNGVYMGVYSLGPILGGIFVGRIGEAFGTLELVLISCAFIIPFALAMEWGIRECGEPTPKKKTSHSSWTKELGIDLFKQNKNMFALFLAILCSQAVAAVVTLRFQAAVSEQIVGASAQAGYFGNFYAVINAFSMAMQFLGTSLTLAYVSVGVVMLAIPIVHIFAGVWAFYSGSLEVVALAAILFKGLDYSLFRGAKETLYIPLDFDAKYRTKKMIDVLGYRAGKGGISLVVAILRKLGPLTESGYSILAIFLALLWAGFSWPIVTTSGKGPKKSVLFPTAPSARRSG